MRAQSLIHAVWQAASISHLTFGTRSQPDSSPNVRCKSYTILVVCLASLMSSNALAADGPAAMVIFDGSGSMWGRLEADKKPTKLDTAREALRQALSKLPTQSRIGLMSFGHRRQADCSDIEVIAPLQAGDAARLMTPLDKHNPRGKGPIAGVLREAAKALATDPQASIILINDNADNCRQDPCEAAAEIAKAMPQLRIHVVGLGIDPDELARIACVPKMTSGKLFDARDPSAVSAGIAEALQLALLERGEGRDGPLVPSPATGAAAVPRPGDAAGPAALRLTAKLGPKSPPLPGPLNWRVFKAGSDAPLYSATALDPLVPVEAGRYSVEGGTGFVSARIEVEAKSQGATAVELVLDAAALRLEVKAMKDGDVLASPLVTIWPLREGGPVAGLTNATPPLWLGRAGDADLLLPAGSYAVRVEESHIDRSETVVLAAGAVVKHAVVLSAGRLELSAAAKPDGEPLDGVTFLISRDDPDAPEGRREIARSAASRPAFLLPAGTYYVTARQGVASVRDRVGIGAGDTVKRVISLGLARLSVAAEVTPVKPGTPAASRDVARLPIAARVLTLDGEPREIARALGAVPEFSLSAGRYRIEASVGTNNVRATQDVDLEPGGARRVALKLDATQVVFKLKTGSG
jgi:Ca-activated chloride channel homolog